MDDNQHPRCLRARAATKALAGRPTAGRHACKGRRVSKGRMRAAWSTLLIVSGAFSWPATALGDESTTAIPYRIASPPRAALGTPIVATASPLAPRNPSAIFPAAPVGVASVAPQPIAAGAPAAMGSPASPPRVASTGRVPRTGRVLETADPAVAQSLTALQLYRQSDQLRREAELSLRRGATATARETAIASLRLLSAAADLETRGAGASQALDAALVAVREAGDFLGRYGHVDAPALRRMIDSHATPVLKERGDARDGGAWMSPHAAADAYLDHARGQLTRAAGGRSQAADVMTLLARIESASDHPSSALADAIAMTYLRAALTTHPADAQAAKALGQVALRAGLLDEARWALEHSLALQPDRATVQSLVDAHRMAGDHRRADRLAASMPEAHSEQDGPTISVMTVDPQVFAAISPPVQRGASQDALGTGWPAGAGAGSGAGAGGSVAAGPATAAGSSPSAASGNSVATPAPPPSVLDRVAGVVRGWWQ